MITIQPAPRVLVPVDSSAATRVSGQNYDEFQSDLEIWELLQAKPDCILRITMPHCDAARPEEMLPDGSPESLERAADNLRELVQGPLARVVENAMWIYEIEDKQRPGVRQIGLGCLGTTAEIRTEQTPDGTIIRNEGIREEKAQGRARLIEKTNTFIGGVNNAIQDRSGRITEALEAVADSRACDFAAEDEVGNRHKIWLVTDAATQHKFQELFAAEPAAYVADGNHRSAAAALLGKAHFLSVFFTTGRMGLAPYNRLVQPCGVDLDALLTKLQNQFEIENLGPLPNYRPPVIHEIGLYTEANWYRLRPRPTAYDAANAVQTIDADIVQRQIFDAVLGITDPRDKRLTFVGGNKDSAYLKHMVDTGDYQYAVSLAPVTMQQFVAVCEQNRFMPPKSTWFEPKIRSGLVVVLLEA